MFDFGRSISDAVRSRMAAVEQHRDAVKQHPQEKRKEQSSQRMSATERVEARIRADVEQANIAAYFNQQARDVPGYQMSLREKDASGAGSNVLMEPTFVHKELIASIQRHDEYFLEGHVRTGQGLIKDVLDGAYPHEIRREQNGQRDILETKDLEAYTVAMQRAAKSIAPKYTVVARDDLRDIPLAGARESREQGPSF